MGDTIQSSMSAADRLADSYRKGISDYLDTSGIQKIYELVSCSDNDVHDSFETSISRALEAWSNLVEADASTITLTAQEFSQIDDKIAKTMLGTGDRPCSSNSALPKML